MVPVFVLGDNEQRMQHIGQSVAHAECVPLRNVKLNAGIMDSPIPSLMAPSIIMLDMDGDANNDLNAYVKRLKMAYYDSAILVMLPFGDTEGEKLSMEAGVDDIVMRPVSINRLSITLKNLSEIVSRRVAMSDMQYSVRANSEMRSQHLSLLNEEGNLKRFHQLEQEIIQYSVKHCRGHISQAARALGIGRSTLYRKIDAMETRIRFQQKIQEKLHASKVFK